MMIRKTGIAILLFCLVYLNSHAQTSDLQHVRIGAKIAPSIIWLKPNTPGIVGNGSKLGFSYGLMLDFNLTKNYTISTGLDVAYRGGKLKDKTYGYSTDPRNARYNLQYLQFPFCIKLKTNEIGYITYFGKAGLETGYNISAHGTDLNNYPSSTDNENIRSEIIPLNLSLLIEIGAEYTLGGHTSVMASAYFSNGFVDVIRTKTPNFDARSNALGLNVGIFF
jgi:hypothetical protein